MTVWGTMVPSKVLTPGVTARGHIIIIIVIIIVIIVVIIKVNIIEFMCLLSKHHAPWPPASGQSHIPYIQIQL